MKNVLLTFFAVAFLISCDKTECIESNCTDGVPLSYIPVCGCNDVTYPNWETAECHGILNYREGECESD